MTTQEPRWLSRQIIEAIHTMLIREFGGADGLRDESSLESAIGRPVNKWSYENAGVFTLAAAYAFGFAKNKPFIDGNKRIAFVSAYTFLGLNGFRLQASEELAVVMTLQLASSEITKTEYEAWLRAESVPNATP